MNTTKQVVFGSALVAMTFWGCGANHDSGGDGVGNAHISVSTEALTVADVATVKVTVSGAHSRCQCASGACIGPVSGPFWCY